VRTPDRGRGVVSAMSGDCPRCGAVLRERQRWCLECGASAGTAVAPASRWLAPTLVASLVTALALAGLGYAVATLAGS
jgi:hypothetical protein